MDELRAEFPVFERLAYLNAGTNGPAPRRGVEAAAASLRAQAEEGRGGGPFFLAVIEQAESLRGRVAALLGCEADEVALTGSTTDGVNAALAALDLEEGAEVLTSDQEHPGVLAPLGAARERRGLRVRTAPFAELAGHVGPDTRLVATSHVSWITGQEVDAAALAATGVPVLLDGAQGLGAVPVDVRELRCDFYAASGQKWLCGPNGIGYLFARRERAEQLVPPWPGYMSLTAPDRPLDLELQPGARRFDMGVTPPHQVAWALGALDVLEEPGIARVHERAAKLGAKFADRLAERGAKVAPRGATTLVSWEDPDPPAAAERLLADGFVVRFLPGTPYVRASIGAWTSEEEVDRLLDAAL
ncbi:MAG TPA: aminotransferase class V-fold PLP-dependent enzyme [Thermoleophilaceae bacterium]|nr:aminotransferase class V-fold PLP-dependent enzyme [Thermoleophilaceae bacterium]